MRDLPDDGTQLIATPDSPDCLIPKAQVAHLMPDDIELLHDQCPYCTRPEGYDACPIHP